MSERKLRTQNGSEASNTGWRIEDRKINNRHMNLFGRKGGALPTKIDSVYAPVGLRTALDNSE
jgi:hypothetical protein